MGFRPTQHGVGSGQSSFATYTDDVNSLEPPRTGDKPWWLSESAALDNQLHATQFLEAMATCAGITYFNGTLVGDPMDVIMFQCTGWVLDEDIGEKGVDEVVEAYIYPSAEAKESKPSYKNSLLRRFDFASGL